MSYSVQTSFILPRYALWKSLRQVDAGFLSASHGGEHQRRFGVIVAAYRTILMTSIYKELLRIALVCVHVWLSPQA